MLLDGSGFPFPHLLVGRIIITLTYGVLRECDERVSEGSGYGVWSTAAGIYDSDNSDGKSDDT